MTTTTKRRTIRARATLIGVALVTQGCIGGVVLDAASGAPLAGVQVAAIGGCLGTGCGDGIYQTQTTNVHGEFVFDAYGDIHGAENVQIITPQQGNEAAILYVSKAGYQPRIVYVRPQYDNPDAELYGEKLARRIGDVFLCATGAPDVDGDSLCDAAEDRYGTDPNRADTDGDGLSDAAELFGDSDVDLPYYGADPLHRDLFVEIDYFSRVWDKFRGAYVDTRPTQTDIDAVVAAFAAAPVDNPDGRTGIQLHIVVDDGIGEDDAIEIMTGLEDLYALKSRFFDPRRARIFRYGLFANFESILVGGRAELPGVNFVVYLGGRGISRAAALMHELGHNLGLGHGGQDSLNHKPHYLSVMNYLYSDRGVRIDGVDTLDYSRVSIAGLSEAALSEPFGFAPTAGSTEAELARYSVQLRCSDWLSGTASANLDFNDNGRIDSGLVSADLDCDQTTQGSWGPSQNDWAVLNYTANGRIGQVQSPGASLASEPEEVVCELEP